MVIVVDGGQRLVNKDWRFENPLIHSSDLQPAFRSAGDGSFVGFKVRDVFGHSFVCGFHRKV